jgi:hypothetical protein
MISNENKKFIFSKFNIDADKYTDEELKQLLDKIINRNDRIININYQKIGLLTEINKDINSYLNGGN